MMSRVLPAAFVPLRAALAIAVLAIPGCGGSIAETSIVGADGVRCQTTATAERSTVPAEGGAVRISIASARDCTWAASSDVGWIGVDPVSGQGNGSLTATVQPNEEPASRTGTVVVNEQRVALAQDPRPCRYELRDAAVRVGPEGGRASVEVATHERCTWSASTAAAWVRVLTASGAGSGAVNLEVASNDGDARQAVVSVAGESLLVQQEASPAHRQAQCTYVLNPPSETMTAVGGGGRFRVTTQDVCEWSPSSSASWVTVTGGVRTGSGDVQYFVQTNPAVAARTASIRVGGQTHTITQEASARVCEYILTPASRQFSAAGGSGQIQVTSPAACRWTAASAASWVVIRSAAGLGNEEVQYSVLVNTGAARTTTITIGGQVHTVSQSAAARRTLLR